MTTLRVKVGEQWYTVTVGDLSRAPLEVSVDGQTYFCGSGRAGAGTAAAAAARPPAPQPYHRSGLSPHGGSGQFL